MVAPRTHHQATASASRIVLVYPDPKLVHFKRSVDDQIDRDAEQGCRDEHGNPGVDVLVDCHTILFKYALQVVASVEEIHERDPHHLGLQVSEEEDEPLAHSQARFSFTQEDRQEIV